MKTYTIKVTPNELEQLLSGMVNRVDRLWEDIICAGPENAKYVENWQKLAATSAKVLRKLQKAKGI